MGLVKKKKTDNDDCLYFEPVYAVDRELEKFLRDVGGHISKLAYVEGKTDTIVDDEKLCRAYVIPVSLHENLVNW